MHYKQIIYCSRNAERMLHAQVHELVEQARTHNATNGVTGILVFNSQYFLQVIEGMPDAVDALYERIQRDARHAQVQTIIEQHTGTKHWQSWSMGLVVCNTSNEAVFLRHFGAKMFDPYAINAQQSESFLSDISICLLD